MHSTVRSRCHGVAQRHRDIRYHHTPACRSGLTDEDVQRLQVMRHILGENWTDKTLQQLIAEHPETMYQTLPDLLRRYPQSALPLWRQLMEYGQGAEPHIQLSSADITPARAAGLTTPQSEAGTQAIHQDARAIEAKAAGMSFKEFIDQFEVEPDDE